MAKLCTKFLDSNITELCLLTLALLSINSWPMETTSIFLSKVRIFLKFNNFFQNFSKYS